MQVRISLDTARRSSKEVPIVPTKGLVEMKNCPTPGCKTQVPDNFRATQVCSFCLFHGPFAERMKVEKIERTKDAK